MHECLTCSSYSKLFTNKKYLYNNWLNNKKFLEKFNNIILIQYYMKFFVGVYFMIQYFVYNKKLRLFFNVYKINITNS